MAKQLVVMGTYLSPTGTAHVSFGEWDGAGDPKVLDTVAVTPEAVASVDFLLRHINQQGEPDGVREAD